MKKTLFIIAALFLTLSIANLNAQNRKREVRKIKKELKKRAIREARKEAKQLSKEGWDVQPGSMPLPKLLERSWIKQLEENDEGGLRYIYADGNGVAQTVSAAEMQAMNLAQLQLASQISTRVASLVNTNIANMQNSTLDANTVTEVVQSAKNIVAAKLGRVDPVFKIIRKAGQGRKRRNKLAKGNVEMQVRIFYDKSQAEMKAKEAIKEEFRKKTKATEEELKKLMGM